MKKLMLVSITTLRLLVGCDHPPHSDTKITPPATDQTTALSGAEVLAIAQQAVATNDNWLGHAEFESPRRQADGSWSVLVWRLPKTPGGHRVIQINDKGQVTSYHRGA